MGRSRQNRQLEQNSKQFLDGRLKGTWEGFMKLALEVDAYLHIRGASREEFHLALHRLAGDLGLMKRLNNAIWRRQAKQRQELEEPLILATPEGT